MVGAVAAIIIAVWYYKGAIASNKDPVIYTMVGLALFFIPAILWTTLMTPGIRDVASHNQNGLLVFIVRYAYVAVGIASAVGLYAKLFAKGEVQ